ncbi:cell division protein [Halolamina litorea]|uniref:Cell division protein n=1 Tax=Halolamina litorea TaxID=1515593 RepID=A0ABD6BRT0_9EURY
MKLAVLGVGGAGSRLAARLAAAEPDDRPYVAAVAAVDTDPEQLAAVDVPREHRHAFGTTARSADATTVRTAAEENARELNRAAADAVPSAADAVLVTLGVGGATGAGAAPIVVDTLRERVDLPVYALTVLPHPEEAGVRENARSGLRGLEATVDAQLLFDNGALDAPDERPADELAAEAYADANATVAEWLGALFGAGEATEGAAVGESVVDASEIIATLGEGGYATIGYWREQVREKPSFLDRLRSKSETPDEIKSYSQIETAVRRSLYRRRSVETDLSRATRALLVTMGPPEWLNREAIADARRSLDEAIGGGAVRGGDTPIDGGLHLTVLSVCAGMDRPDRVASLIDDA